MKTRTNISFGVQIILKAYTQEGLWKQTPVSPPAHPRSKRLSETRSRGAKASKEGIIHHQRLHSKLFQYQFFLKHKFKNNWVNKQEEGNLTEE